MKATLKIGVVLGMISLSINAFGQSNDLLTEGTKEVRKIQNTFLDPVFKVVSTSMNYGSSNGALADFKKQSRGIQAGLTFQAGLSPDFSLASELYLIMKGGKLKNNNPVYGKETTDRLYSLELPVMARLHLGKFHTNAGPSVSYNIFGNRKTDGQKRDLSFGRSGQDFKSFEAGIQVGGGYTFKAKKRMVTLDLRYNHGLTNISHVSEIYNRNVMISMHVYQPWKTNPFKANKK